ncbi:ribonuclease H-like domain-containing protein [Tanacetum coccineum]
MAALKFASSHNMVAFLDKPTKSDGFEQIVDFLNTHPIKYALTVNPTIYTSCIEQFWTTAKVKTVNGEVQIQALVDKKKVIITETSVRSDLQLEDAEGTECLPNATIFEQLTLMGYENLTQKLTFYKAFFSPQWKFLIHTILQCLSAKTTAWNEFSSTMASAVICLATNQKFNFSKYIFDNMVKNLEGGVKFLMYPRFVQVFLDKQVEGMSKHKEIYVTPSHTKKVFANMKRQGKDFSGRDTPLFPTMIVQAQEQVGEEPVTNDTKNVASVPTHSNDPLLSGEDKLKIHELMELCTSLSQTVLDLEKTKTSQAAEIIELNEKVKRLENKGGSRTHRLRRLYKGVIAIAAYYDYEIWQMDVKTAFLNGFLEEEIYMEQPEGFIELIINGSIPEVDIHLNKSQCATTSAEMKRMQNVPYASANPGEAHWTAVKNILKYLRNTKDTFLVYGGNPEAELQVKCYCDAGFETDRDDTKSQTRKFIDELGVVPSNDYPIKMNCDNSAAIIIAKESGIQKGTRHFQRKYHYIRRLRKLGNKIHGDVIPLPFGNLRLY